MRGARERARASVSSPAAMQQSRKVRRHGLWLIFFLIFALVCAPARQSDAAQTNAATLKVSGYGFLGNRKLKTLLKNVQPEKKAPPFYDANFVEDAALLLLSSLQR